MENSEESMPEKPYSSLMNDEETPVSAEEVIIYPAKYKKPDQANNIWMRSLVSLALYLALGIYIFKRDSFTYYCHRNDT